MAGIEKKIMLQEVKSALAEKDVFVTKYDRLTVKDFGQLRSDIRKKNGSGMVVKKTIAKLAFKELGMEDASQALDGSVFVVASSDEPQELSKLLVDFAKKKEEFDVTGAFVEGAYRDQQYVKDLASLPSREELIASVVGGIKAPITNFVMGLSGFMKQLVVVLNEVNKTKSE